MSVDNFSLLDGFLVVLSLTVVAIMLRRNIRDAPFWRATVTPLASIIGSGFLVVVPLLASIAGPEAVIAISVIVLLSLWVGSAVRYNILYDGQSATAMSDRVVPGLEHFSDVALAFAFIVSITFYIRLMSGFILEGIDAYTPFNADVMATAVLGFIGFYGYQRGLHGLERLEEYSVTIKLAIIASLLAALIYHDSSQGYDLSHLPYPQIGLVDGLRQLGGMLLIVQGFETSKYLQSSYDAPMRARTMFFAQIVAGVIYVVFVALSMPLMGPFAGTKPSETAIIDMTRSITLVLPIMLVVAATMSQFSAAIADTIGAGGVLEEEAGQRLPAKVGYTMIAALAIGLIWNSDIFEIVSIASRAFAFYYLLQTLLATRLATKVAKGQQRLFLVVSYSILAMILLSIVVFAIPVTA